MARGKGHKLSGIITITTDFGYIDSYIAQMKGVILSINPDARIVDISHSIPSGDILSGSFCLAGAYRYFPAGTIHLAVVDPGVGTERPGLIVDTGEYFFVGPDNGIFTLPLEKEEIKEIYVIDNRKFKFTSNTFHGRDIFAPVCAELSCGTSPREFGVRLQDKRIMRIKIPEPVIKKNVINGCIIHIDNFGNLITNIDAGLIKGKSVMVEVKGRKISGIAKTYGEKKAGTLLTVINSFGLLEIAVNRGSAQKRLRAELYDPVRVVVEWG